MTIDSTEVRELPVNDAPQGGGGNGNIDLLEGVSLRYFTATPTALGPFDSSVLSWHVDGVKSGVRVLLDTTTVAAVSQSTVQPPHSTPFFLSAAAGSARKALGTVTVTVDETTCKETEILNAFFFMRNQLIAQINGNPQTYWSGSTDDPNILSVAPVGGKNIRQDGVPV